MSKRTGPVLGAFLAAPLFDAGGALIATATAQARVIPLHEARSAA